MAYRRKLKIHRVTFDDTHELAGLEIVTRGVKIDWFLAFQRTVAKLQDLDAKIKSLDPSDEAGMIVLAEQLPRIQEEMLAQFADKLVEWNYEEEQEDGSYRAVPPTLEGLTSIDDEVQLGRIVGEWMKAISEPPAPLGDDSSSGETPPVPLPEMEP